MNRTMLGERHPEVANMMGNLAFAIYAQGRRSEGIDLLRSSLSMRRELLGADHPDVASGAASLAYWLIDSNQYPEAGTLIEESLLIRRKQFGEDSPAVASSLTVRANLQLGRHDYGAAAQDARDAATLLAVKLGATHWQVAMANNALGAALTGLGRYTEAEALLKTSLPGLKDAPIPRVSEKGQQRLAALYTSWGKPELAAPYLHP